MSSNQFYQKQPGNRPKRRESVMVIDSNARKEQPNNPDGYAEQYLRRTIKLFAILIVCMGALLVLSIKYVEYQWGRRDRNIRSVYQPGGAQKAPAVLSTQAPKSVSPPAPPTLIEQQQQEAVDEEIDNANSAKVDTILRWGKILEEAGELEGALDRYGEALKVAPDNLEVLTRAGRLNIRLSRYDEAVAVLSTALEYANEDPDILNDLGVALTFNNQIHDAVKLYEDLRRQHPDYTPALFNEGYALLQIQEYERARPLLERYIQDKPEDSMALGVLAVLELNDANYDRALSLFDKAIELSPEWSMPYLDAATICATTDRGDDALTYLTRALEFASPAEIYQRYQTPPFNDIRSTDDGRKFEKKVADQARNLMNM